MRINYLLRAWLVSQALFLNFGCNSQKYYIEDWIEDQKYVDSANYFFYDVQNYEEAIFYFQKAKRYPQQFYSNIAYCHLELADTISAIENYKLAIKSGFKKEYIEDANIREKLSQVVGITQDSILECTLLECFYRDQLPRNKGFTFNKYILKEYDYCIDSSWVKIDDYKVGDTINLRILNNLRNANNYPFRHKIYNDFIFDIPTTIILHQSKQTNDSYIDFIENHVKTKELPYYHLFKIMENRIKRFGDKDKCTLIEITNSQNSLANKLNMEKCYLYSAFTLIKDNPSFNCKIEMNNENYNLLKPFIDKYINHPSIDISIIPDFDNYKFCFTE